MCLSKTTVCWIANCCPASLKQAFCERAVARAEAMLWLTLCILVDASTFICWTSPFVILAVSGLFCRFYLFIFFWKILLVKTADPYQTPHFVASDLGLHCLSMTLYGFPGKNGLIIIHRLLIGFCAHQ